MKDWIVVAALYLFGMGVFRLLGGIGAASEALRKWGRASSTDRTAPGSPS
jgi:hypothetical protein